MTQQIIAKGKVVLDTPSFYLVDKTTGLMGMKATRHVRLGLWAQDYLDQTLVISVEKNNDEKE